MTTALVATFLFLHGLVHLPVWLAPTGRDGPFDPRHSGVLAAAGLPQARAGTAAVSLASATTLLYVIAGAVTAAQSSGRATAAVTAAAAACCSSPSTSTRGCRSAYCSTPRSSPPC
ncbi:hypothetical protein ACFVYG_29060 [Streptomyces sp. NPDC058256]|uniref:hypothetical protein n=1 Tax=Streptomyces sp. NPDC058256 TaxID=3346408 RepID=UPI0036EBBC15